MPQTTPEQTALRVAVILGSSGSSKNLLDQVMPLLGGDGAIEIKGVFLEEAGIQHAAELPFVKELCRVTFNVREFNSEQFERALALRMRTARRAISVLARHAGVQHSFHNVRGSAVSLVQETASQSDITIFEPARKAVATMTPHSGLRRPRQQIVVAIGDEDFGRKAMAVATHLAEGRMNRVSVLLLPSFAAGDSELGIIINGGEQAMPGQVRIIPGYDISSLAEAVQAEGAAILVAGATGVFMQQDTLQAMRERLHCTVCLVR
ncbi:MAG: hypothetical protein GWP58_00345 [Gammaproteobacteria bacterium]|jgi:hypothetical protein|nr:hypothetical protein [Gammaproteobacteria bacterium]